MAGITSSQATMPLGVKPIATRHTDTCGHSDVELIRLCVFVATHNFNGALFPTSLDHFSTNLTYS